MNSINSITSFTSITTSLFPSTLPKEDGSLTVPLPAPGHHLRLRVVDDEDLLGVLHEVGVALPVLHQDVLKVGDGGEVLLADDLGGEEGEGHDEKEHAEAAEGDRQEQTQLVPRAARALSKYW